MKFYYTIFVLIFFSKSIVQAQVVVDALGNQHIIKSLLKVEVELKDKSIYIGKCKPTPQFNGGVKKMYQYIKENLEWSSDLYLSTSVRFLVNEEGSIEIPFVLISSGDKVFDMAALRLVEAMPDWKAGIAEGNTVKTFVTLEVQNPRYLSSISTVEDEDFENIIDNYSIEESNKNNKKASFGETERELFTWVNKNLHYPAEAREKNIKGIVLAGFIVEANGEVSSGHILKSSGSELLDNEVIRLIGIMPNWNPAELSGTPKSVFLSMPVYFLLE